MNDIRLRIVQPSLQVVVGDVDGLISGVSFVVLIPSRHALTVLWVVGHAAYEVNAARKAGVDEISPDCGAPACDFCDTVS